MDLSALPTAGALARGPHVPRWRPGLGGVRHGEVFASGREASGPAAALTLMLDGLRAENADGSRALLWVQDAASLRLTGEKAVSVTGPGGSVRFLRARYAVVLATGTTATVPDIPGLRDALPWTSRDVTNLHEIPRRMAVIGGGVVACESSTWLDGLGVDELTIIAEARPESWDGRGLVDHADRIATHIKNTIGISSNVRVVAPATLERSLGKAKRLYDKRPKD